MTGYVNSQYLVETDWLERHLGDPDLRVFDATVYLRPPSPDAPRERFETVSGRADWESGHIPGSGFADLIHDLSDPESKLPFMAPSADRFATAVSRLGAGRGTRVVCYDRGRIMWAARLWWLFRYFGFDDVAVLNGGWEKWKAEGRAVSTEPSRYPAGIFTADVRPELLATKDDVLAAIEGGHACVINALSEAQHRGESGSYGRRGHIATSVNVPAAAMVDDTTMALLPAEVLRERFDGVGALSAGRVITYCGGGIAATGSAFALALLGNDQVAVYDGSLSEWAKDDSLPMATA